MCRQNIMGHITAQMVFTYKLGHITTQNVLTCEWDISPRKRCWHANTTSPLKLRWHAHRIFITQCTDTQMGFITVKIVLTCKWNTRISPLCWHENKTYQHLNCVRTYQYSKFGDIKNKQQNVSPFGDFRRVTEHYIITNGRSLYT